MEREIVKISDFSDTDHYDDWDDEIVEVVDDVTWSIELEKGLVEHNCVFIRYSDYKYFRFSFNTWVGGTDLLRQTATEVFPRTVTETKVVTTTFYE